MPKNFNLPQIQPHDLKRSVALGAAILTGFSGASAVSPQSLEDGKLPTAAPMEQEYTPVVADQQKPTLAGSRENTVVKKQKEITPVDQRATDADVTESEDKVVEKPKKPSSHGKSKDDKAEPEDRKVLEHTKGKPVIDQMPEFEIIEDDDYSPDNSSELIDLNPESLNVPENVSALMAKNAVYIDPIGCSGFLIRNDNDQAIGLWTAQHCQLMTRHNRISTNESGENQISFDRQPTAFSGDSFDQLNNVSKIDKYVVSDKAEMTKDVALGSFENSDINEVIARGSLSAEVVSQLSTGDVVYSFGWPVSQEVSPIKRQEFAMHVLGTASVRVEGGQVLQELLMAVPKSKDGAACTPGNSGSLIFKMDENGKYVPLGISSSYRLLTDSNREYYENLHGVDLSGYEAVCGAAFEDISSDDAKILHVKQNETVDPEPSAHEIAMKRYREAFFSPDFERTGIDGYVSFTSGKDGNYSVESPAVYYDEPTEMLVFAWYQDGAENNLIVNPISISYLDSVKAYGLGEEGQPLLNDISGEIENVKSSPEGVFKTIDGKVFGKAHYDLETPDGDSHSIGVSDGKLIFKSQNTTQPLDDQPVYK